MEISYWENEFGKKIYRVASTVNQPKAAIGFVHGLGEHIHRYEELFAFYNKHNISCYGFDSTGFGRSEGKRADVKSAFQWQNEIDMLLNWMNENENCPTVLYGHSLGGQKVLSYLLQSKRLPTLMISSSPFIEEGTKTAPLKLQMGKLLSNIFPTMTLKNDLNLAGLSRKMSVIKAYQEDEFVTSKISLRLATISFQVADWLKDGNFSTPIPLRITHGTKDELTSYIASKNFAEKMEGQVTFSEWEGGFHELHNDTCAAEYNQSNLDWILKNVRI